MITYGIIVLQRGSFKGKKKKPIISKNRKLAYFQSQFGFGILVIAILISFSIQSMNDDREFFMYFWGVLAMVGVGYIVIYRDKKLQEIFDDDDYPLETKPKSEIKKKL